VKGLDPQPVPLVPGTGGNRGTGPESRSCTRRKAVRLVVIYRRNAFDLFHLFPGVPKIAGILFPRNLLGEGFWEQVPLAAVFKIKKQGTGNRSRS